MDSTDLVTLVLRWAHVLAAIAAFGGLLFARFGLVPGLAEVDAATRDRIHEAIRRHFLATAAEHPDRYLVVDGTEPPERLHAQVLARLDATGVGRP